jgi:hypothetical protein
MRAWQAKWDSAVTGRFPYSIFPDVTLRPWFEGQKEEIRFVCTVSKAAKNRLDRLMLFLRQSISILKAPSKQFFIV